MVKLVILIEPPKDINAFDEQWPQFLHLAEAIPGLRKETSGSVELFLYGQPPIYRMHELHFDTLEDAERGLDSPAGQAAGRFLQHLCAGRLMLFLASHHEDTLERIRHYQEKGRGAAE